MARYKRLPSGYFAQRYNYLINAGFEDWESRELTYGTRYTTFKRNRALGNSDPALYIQRLIRWRRLYVGNLKRAGYNKREIHRAILRLYETKGWKSAPKGFVGVGERRDPLKMLRQFRKATIASGDYIRPPRPKRPGSHHPLKRQDIEDQGKRRARKSQGQMEPTSGSTMFGRKTPLQHYAEGRGRE